VEVSFSVEPLSGREIMEGELSNVRFTVKDTATGAPLSTLRPSVWLDMEKTPEAPTGGASLGCKEKIGLYLQGSMSYRPDLDLNSYFILSMNHDATISVTDPIVSFTGITQLYTMINLKRPGEDWVTDRQEKRLFVTMPRANQVAVADLETFKVIKDIDAGAIPFRIGLQPDGKYIWVGNNSPEKGQSGVTVIDAEKMEVVARIPTGAGHHEIAFSDDSLFAFVTNENDANLSVIDVQNLSKIRDVETGPGLIAVAFSGLSKAVYAASGLDGTVTVLDARTHQMSHRIRMKPGIRTLRFAPGGRWGFVANSHENMVDVFDASDHRVHHTFDVGKEPHQIAFTKDYAYVRCKGSEMVSLIPLSAMGKAGTVATVKVPIGQSPPGISPFHATAEAIVATPEPGHALIVNPADRMIYYYMEGMNYAMGSFRSYGGTVQKAVRVVDRSLREKETGVYGSTVRIPSSGRYQVAFLLDTPRIIHCFEFAAKTNPALVSKAQTVPTLEFLTKERRVRMKETFRLQFKIRDPGKGEPIRELKDVVVQATLAPGNWNQRFEAREKEEGVYEMTFSPPERGAYYLTVSCPSLGMDFRQFPYVVIRAAGQQDSPE
jgi:DNA-binding beta-propeller fold protein YncE